MEALTKKLVLPLRADLDVLRGEVRGLRAARSTENAEYPRVERETGIPRGPGYRRYQEPYIYYFYQVPGHGRDSCRDLSRLVNEGKVHLNERGRIYLGPIAAGAHEVIFPRDGTSGKEYIMKLLSAPSLSTEQEDRRANDMTVSAIRLGVSREHEEDIDEEYYEHRVGIAAAR